MIVLSSLDASEAPAAEDVLVEVFGEDYRDLAHHYLAAMFSNDFRRPHFIAARDSGKIVGLIAYSEELFTVGVWGLSWVGVLAAYRGHGIGRRLVDVAMNAIQDHVQGPFEIILATYPQQVRLYDKCGFKTLGGSHYMVKSFGSETQGGRI